MESRWANVDNGEVNGFMERGLDKSEGWTQESVNLSVWLG